MKTTNVMRMLKQAEISYETAVYPVDENDLSGEHAAMALGMPMEMAFKTLVLHGEKTGYFVCCVPVDKEIDLKKAAKAAKDKKAELIPMKQLLSVTGYIRGGCSPVGMKKQYPTYMDKSAQKQKKIAVSAGTRGEMILLEPEILRRFIHAEYCDLVY